MSDDVTAESIEAEVRRLAAERPTYIYMETEDDDFACRYVDEDGAPGCIFGHALSNLGISIERLRVFDAFYETSDRETLGASIDRVMEELRVRGSVWFFLVQEYQDRGFSWAEAVKAADHLASNPRLAEQYLDKLKAIREQLEMAYVD